MRETDFDEAEQDPTFHNEFRTGRVVRGPVGRDARVDAGIHDARVEDGQGAVQGVDRQAGRDATGGTSRFQPQRLVVPQPLDGRDTVA